MNPFRDEVNFNDSLGQRIQWSLRGDADVQPSREVWMNIERRIQTLELPPCTHQSHRSVSARSILIGKARQSADRLAHLLTRAMQLLDEKTVSSETIWSRNPSDVFAVNVFGNRTISLWVAARPIFGLMMPIC